MMTTTGRQHKERETYVGREGQPRSDDGRRLLAELDLDVAFVGVQGGLADNGSASGLLRHGGCHHGAAGVVDQLGEGEVGAAVNLHMRSTTWSNF